MPDKSGFEMLINFSRLTLFGPVGKLYLEASLGDMPQKKSGN